MPALSEDIRHALAEAPLCPLGPGRIDLAIADRLRGRAAAECFPTATVTTLMLAGVLALIAWDLDRWLPILDPRAAAPPPEPTTPPPIDPALWRACGAGILVFYGLTCLAYGGVYRPKGLDLAEPAFYVLPLIALFPVVTWVVERRRRARSAAGP